MCSHWKFDAAILSTYYSEYLLEIAVAIPSQLKAIHYTQVAKNLSWLF